MPSNFTFGLRRIEGGGTDFKLPPYGFSPDSGDLPLTDPTDQTVTASLGVITASSQSVTVTNQDGYEIQRREDGGSWHFQAFDTVSPYVDSSSFTAGVLYEYQVRQWTSGVAGSWSNTSGVTFTASAQVDAALGQITVTPLAATIIPGAVSITASLGLITASGLQSTIVPGSVTVTASLGSAAFTGLQSSPSAGSSPQTVNAALGAITSSGLAATVIPGAVSVAASLGNIVSTGLSSTITSHSRVNAALGAGSFTGLQATIIPGAVTVSASLASSAVTGLQATITAAGAENTFDQNGVTYLLRDKFTSDASPVADGNASEGSGVGYRDVYGTGFYTSNGRLRGGNNSTEGKIVYKRDSGTAGWSRVGGRTFAAMYTMDDADGDMSLWLAETAGTLNGYGIRLSGKTVYCIDPDGTEITALITDGNQSQRAINYLVGITLNDTIGAVYWISTQQSYTPQSDWEIPAYPDARILFVSTNGSFTTVHPTIRANSGFNYPGGVVIEDVRLLDVSSWAGADGMALAADRFDRADSSTTLGSPWTADTGTWGISSNKAYVVSGSQVRASRSLGVSDYWVVANIDIATATSDTFGLLVRVNSADKGDRAYLANEDSQNVYFKRWLNPEGFQNTDYSTYMAWANTTTVRMIVGVNGNQARAWMLGAGNGTVAQPFSIGTTHTTGTYAGMYGDTNTRWDYWAAYPIKMTLPTSVFNSGSYPREQSVGTSNKVYDTFTDTNGTSLASHSQNTGTGWTSVNGTWTIQSNKSEASGASGDLLAITGSSFTDVQITSTVTMPSSFTQLRAGFNLRYADINNHVRVRMFVDDVNQLNNDEIEIQEIIGGSGNVVHKCYLGNYFQPNTSYTLKAIVVGDILYVYLDGQLKINVYLSNSSLLTGTSHGMYREGGSANVAWDDFTIVRAGSLFVESSLASSPVTGLAASVTSHSLVAASLASSSMAGLQATVTAASQINASLGSVSVTGLQATVTSHSRVSASLGQATVTGLQASVSAAGIINANLGQIQSSGLQATIIAPVTINATFGQITSVGLQSSVNTFTGVNAGLGVITATGLHATVTPGPVTVTASLANVHSTGLQSVVSAGDNPIVYVRINTLRRRQE